MIKLCRTYNGFDINFTEEYYKKLLEEVIKTKQIPDNYLLSGVQKDGRGNICPATIILPTLAMQAKKKAEKKNLDAVEEFFKILEVKFEECKDSLIERYNWICSQPAKSATFMWENNTMKGYEGDLNSAMKHGTLAIGKIGIAETLQILIGENHLSENGMKLAKRIEQFYLDKCGEYKEKYKLNFGVYETPAESLCYTAMKKFQKKYGKIPNVSDRDFFTNSMHIPVWEEISPFEKINRESELTGYSNAGCITYVELNEEARNNEKAVEQLIDYAMDKDIPYFALNLQNNYCKDCGFDQVPEETCPKCGSKNIFKPRRVTGYLTGDYRTAFNQGKIEETKARFKHFNKLK